MRNRSFAWLLVVAFAGFGAHAAFASPVGGLAPPVVDINGTPLDLAALNCEPRDGQVFCGVENLQGDGYALSLSLALNPDPSITGSFTLTNLSATTQVFSISMTLSVAPVGPALSITGSIGAGTLTDMNANGATLTDGGSSIYTAEIDGAPMRTLLDPPQSYSAPANPFGGPSTISIPMASFGPEGLSQAINLTIGIGVRFSLTSGDSTAFPIAFAAQPVPEPGTLLLLGSGVAGLVLVGRRAR